MKIKEVKPINFLFYRTRTTLDQLSDFVSVGQMLYREAVNNNLPITGPVQWHYYDFSGDPLQPFDFEIALPVGDLPVDYDGRFHVKRTDDFKCVSVFHEGNWVSIPQTYSKIIDFVKKESLVILNTTREVYINVDLKNEEANVTEIQFGIQ